MYWLERGCCCDHKTQTGRRKKRNAMFSFFISSPKDLTGVNRTSKINKNIKRKQIYFYLSGIKKSCFDEWPDFVD